VTVDDNICSWEDGRLLTVPVPVTDEDVIRQASKAVDNALKDGKNRQVIRFALTEKEYSLRELSLWPGGFRHIYRESAGLLTRDFLETINVPTSNVTNLLSVYKPNIMSKDM